MISYELQCARHCERSEAIQFPSPCGEGLGVDCFAIARNDGTFVRRLRVKPAMTGGEI